MPVLDFLFQLDNDHKIIYFEKFEFFFMTVRNQTRESDMPLYNRIFIFFMPLVPKPIVKIFSKKYVAGDNLSKAGLTIKKLNNEGIIATMDVLGESTTKENETLPYVEEYIKALHFIKDEQLDCNISLKPTQLGLLIDKELCYKNIKTIVQEAKLLNNFVRIDMEDSTCTSDTIELYHQLRQEFDNIGVVIQAYLRRSYEDIASLSKERANFRLCKGIYIEPRKIAYKDPAIVNNNFALLIKTALYSRSYVGIATHDEKVVWETIRIVNELGLNKNEFEFQMLLGVDEELRSILVNAGYRLRVYVPYGKNWYAYVMRRLKENPKIAIYVLKALFKK